MLRYGDPHFGLHVAMGQFISLIVYHLSTAQLLPYDIPHAATVLQSYLAELEDTVAESDFPDLDLSPLESAIQFFSEQADKIDKAAKQAVAFNDTVLIDVVNSKYRDFSRGFASAGGLPGRETFRNVLSAPGIDNGYGADVFPGVTDSLGAGKREQAEEWIEKSGRAVRRAAEILGI